MWSINDFQYPQIPIRYIYPSICTTISNGCPYSLSPPMAIYNNSPSLSFLKAWRVFKKNGRKQWEFLKQQLQWRFYKCCAICGIKAPLTTSLTKSNSRRSFYGCSKPQNIRSNYNTNCKIKFRVLEILPRFGFIYPQTPWFNNLIMDASEREREREILLWLGFVRVFRNFSTIYACIVEENIPANVKRGLFYNLTIFTSLVSF